MEEILKKKLQKRIAADQLRGLNAKEGLLDFSSNDYLGLSRDESLSKLIETEYSQLDISLGSGGSRLLAGNSMYFDDLEKMLARTHQSSSALILNSGYVANLAVFSTIPQKGDTVIYDELIHACIKDGVRLSPANFFSFKHNDIDSLKQKLSKATGNVFVAVESIYSMDGDMAPLLALSAFCKEKGLHLIVDEAHSTGVYGENGSGLCCELGIEKDVFIRIHTFGKGMGCHGACVVSSPIVKDYLVNFSRPFIYTTAMPLHSLVTIKNAYAVLEGDQGRQKKLKSHIELFKSLVHTSIESTSAIQAVLIPGNSNVKKKAKELQEKGFDIRPVMSPTVKEGTERLRICLHAHNSEVSIRELADLLK